MTTKQRLVKVLVIETSGTIWTKEIDAKSLDDIYQTIQCDCVERICLGDKDKSEMWFDEEGKLKGLPYNRKATIAAHTAYDLTLGDYGLHDSDCIVGPALIFGKTDRYGYNQGVSDRFIKSIMGLSNLIDEISDLVIEIEYPK